MRFRLTIICSNEVVIVSDDAWVPLMSKLSDYCERSDFRSGVLSDSDNHQLVIVGD